MSCQQVTEDVSPIRTPSQGTFEESEDPEVSPIATPSLTPYVFETSEPGKVTIHGELLAMDPDNLPDPDDAIFLVPLPDDQVTMIPPISPGEVPQADVNEVTGEFVFTNIESGVYAVVGLMITNAQIPARTEEGNFAIVRIEESDRNQTIDLGSIRIP